MNLVDHYEEFLDYLKSEKNVSIHTIKNYTSDFNLFINFLLVNGMQAKFDTVTTQIIRRYIAFLKITKEYSTYTIRRRIHSLSSFYKFLLEQKYIKEDPMMPIHAPEKPDVVPKYFSKEEIKMLLAAPSRYSPENALRNKVILETFLYTGMRRQELLALDWNDINFGEKTITVRYAKGKKQRVVPIQEPLISHLWEYLQSRLSLNNNAVFISSNGNRLSVTPLSQTFHLYMKKLCFDKKGYTIHTLRHTFASHLAMSGVSILTIQKLLDHSDLNSTQIYSHVNTDHLRSEVQKLDY